MGDASDGAPRVFRVPLDWALPELGEKVIPAGGRVESSSQSQSRSYYDTANGDLAAADVVLSRAAGPAEAWRLVIGGASLSVSASGRGVPAAVRARLLGVRAGAALRVSQRVDSDRTTHVVLDADGVEVGEIVDLREHVATTGPAAMVSERRHVEVSGWQGPYVGATAKRLRKSGAIPVEGVAPTTDIEPSTVGAALQVYLADRWREMVHSDLALRDGGAAVHAMRVAIRRLRSALRVVDVTDAQQRAVLDAELSWFAGLLGEVRDREVLRSHLADVGRGGAADASIDTAAAFIGAVLEAEETAARSALTAAMAGRRYLALLRTVREWVDEPPLTAGAAKPATRLGGFVERAEHRVDKRLVAAGRADADEDVDAGLHRARKAAKRARYVANLAAPVIGKSARKTAKSAKRLQQDLGEHQDAVVAAAFLHRVAEQAAATQPDAAFGCGVLWAREQRRVDRLRRRATR